MSRVRVLNLPRTVTEQEVRSHFSQAIGGGSGASLPLEMTDCRLVTKEDTRYGRQIARMAFVGFRTAAAGERAIKLFDGTFLGTQKIRVELAQGLPTQRETKRKEEEAKRERREKLAEERRAKAAARRGGADEPAGKKGPLSEVDRMQEEFVQRATAKDGPGWANELLVPTAAEQTQASGSGGAGAAAPAEETEEEALERQQQLGDVADDDFLAALTSGTKANDVAKEAEQHEAVVNAAVHAGEYVKDASADADEATPASKKKTKKLSEQEQIAFDSRRVRVANIPYAASAAEVKNFVSSVVGDVAEVHLPLTKDTKQPKGIAFVNFNTSEGALRGLEADGSIFMGRLVRITAAPPDPYLLQKQARLEAEAAAKREAAAAAAAAAAAKEGGGAATPAPAAADDAAATSFKQAKLEKKKRTDGDLMWNPLYVESATAVSKVASSLGVGSDAIVSVEASGAAVRAAVAEAYLTSDAIKTLGDEGINLAAINGASLHRDRSNTTILVKHMPKGMGIDQLSRMFAKHGQLEAVAAPSSAAFALISFVHESDARQAFQKLGYRMVGGSPLFLEWAPTGALNLSALDAVNNAAANEDEDVLAELTKAARKQGATGRAGDDDDDDSDAGGATAAAAADGDEDDDRLEPGTGVTKKQAAQQAAAGPGKAHVAVATVYITNLPFGISEAAFVSFLQASCKKLEARPDLVVKIALQDTKGRAFLTVADQATATYCIAKLNGRTIDGRPVQAQISRSTTTNITSRNTADEPEDGPAGASAAKSNVPPGRNPLKVMVKNLPFEATERDLRQLFSSFSEVKAVRVPQKAHVHGGHHQNNHRGFGFVEFLTEQEAANAVATLANTHLYGRHLVLEYAKL
eukprot:CAMPEP_0174833256 /NCGR_PEP_ID=MMETSP1114-20130205/4126_1 /TAXON_ID=312471 /ORGANISM="Neobodo designis, Strain CCAP 1951/1" /LENGTH=864 /DNA_ID=CAMNT_0016067129 /DNA_START=35 /DNA_END=2629 /DNA_ORIENTATION=-